MTRSNKKIFAFAGAAIMEGWLDLPDEQLIGRAQAGQTAAYGELVRRYQSLVYNIALRLCGDPEEAADLSQEAFLRAFRALDTFEPSRPFKPWIGRIVTNLTYNRLQQTHHGVSLEKLWPGEAEAAFTDTSAEPEKLVLTRERHTAIRQALLALPPAFRAVIELRHFQGLSYEEVAAALEIPLSDVKSNLFRARRLLKQRLGENL